VLINTLEVSKSNNMISTLQRLRHVLPALAFFTGFIWDALTLGSGVSSLDLWILSAYLLATTPIIWWLAKKDNLLASTEMMQAGMVNNALQTTLIHTEESGFIQDPQAPAKPLTRAQLALQNIRIRLPYLLLQFLYGSLFSALFILYFKSASHLTALVWTVSLGALLVANEFFENAYKRFTLTWTLFGFCTILLFNFAIPYAVGSINPIWFYLSVALALIITQFLKTVIAERVGKIWPTYLLAVLLVSAYIYDVIPPVPLVKRDIQVGTQLEKTATQYILMQDESQWWKFWRVSSDTVYVQASDTVYCVSAIYAPSGLNTKLYHRWQKYDEKVGWQTMSRIGYAISGGREDGYRGYTYKKNVADGKWRVNVETENAHTIVSYQFEIKKTQEPVTKAPKVM